MTKKSILTRVAFCFIVLSSVHVEAKRINCESVINFNKVGVINSEFLAIGEVEKKFFGGLKLIIKKNWKSNLQEVQIKQPRAKNTLDTFDDDFYNPVKEGDVLLVLNEVFKGDEIEFGGCDPVVIRINSKQLEEKYTSEVNSYIGPPKYLRSK